MAGSLLDPWSWKRHYDLKWSWNVAQNVFFSTTQIKIFDWYCKTDKCNNRIIGLKKKQPKLLKDELAEATEQILLWVPKIDQIQQILGALYISDDFGKLKD